MRRLTIAIYGLLLSGEILWSAIFPLGPYYHDRFGLSATETGIILASSGVAILVISLPAGILADRLGPRRVTVAASVLLAVSALGHGSASTFWALLVVRLLFGIAFGALWPASLSYLTDVLPDAQQARLLGASVAIAGVGTTIGPAFGGILTERYGIAVPFGIAAIATAALVLALIDTPHPPHRLTEHVSLLDALPRLAGEPIAVAGLLFMILPGFVANTIHLLVPLRLHEHGVSDANVGLGLSAGAILFFCTSATLTRIGARAVTVGGAAAGAFALGALFVIPLVTVAVVPLFVFLVLRAPPTATMFTVSVPLTVRGADRVGVGRGAVLGLSNAVWAVAAIAGPVTAGFLDDHAGNASTWAMDIVLCVAAATWALRVRAR